ncbi:MAG: TAT-variant-translocated molybdopterin oxidoreductase [Vicingaceae bacterium]|nr:TAT-variant-translocated molybdopterin oxidoreductase [Vicingaceae bacterium]
MANSKKYWKGLEQLEETAEFQEMSTKEFSEQLPVEEFLGDEDSLGDAGTTRRDFLKYLGFGVAAASLAACETPVTKAIPYLNKPEEITPGVANYYASTFYDGHDYAAILVKTREGRPIFISGNTESSLTKGAINARINSSVLSLYDGNRLKAPMISGEEASWASIDNRLGKELKAAKNVRVLTNSLISPSAKKLINDFANVVAEGEEVTTASNVVSYDAVSYSGILEANKESFNKSVVPAYNFDKAKTIVSVGADFMGNWLDTQMYITDYAEARKPENDWMSKHFQFEASMSLTGTNADVRTPVKPSEYGAILTGLLKAVGGNVSAVKTKYDHQIADAAKALKASKGASIVVCGSNDKNVQVIVNAINNQLGNYGTTIDLENHSNTKQGSDAAVMSLIKDMNAGKVDALLINGVDPIFTMGDAFKKALAKVKTTVCFATKMNETAEACKYVAATNHQLESWSDAEPVKGHYSLGQPTISPLFDTRQAEDCFLKWSGSDKSFNDVIKDTWETNVYPTSGALMFTNFWNKVLHDGVFDAPSVASSEAMPFTGNVSGAAAAIAKVKGGALEIELNQNMSVGAGSGADNPWLQEMPDPMTKITWENYVTMNPAEMKEKGYNTQFGQREAMNVVNVTVGKNTVEFLPVVPQPGQARGTVGLALGYGKRVGKQEEISGRNAYPLVQATKNGVSYYGDVTLTDVDTSDYYVACTQVHQTIMGRDSIIRETTLDVYKEGNKDDFNPSHTLIDHKDGESVNVLTKEFNIWGKDQPVENIGHRWGMSIDLNSCTGCSACITSCNSENNIAVIGKDEVRRARSMHWMRIDRYYASEYQDAGDIAGTLAKTKEAEDVGTTFGYQHMEDPADNPLVVHQPMMCQHCNHAGCETVCPVAATIHSNEGLNMMAYNRCIGTRYCANNCAYKVRRFNWYNYIAYKKFTDFNPSQDDLGRMVLNPDVVVRSRGVMEKCSMCVQRIQEGKLDAKKAGAKVVDGAIQTACSTACPTNAITFGDLNDTSSKVRAGMESDRSYRVIEEKGQEPNIYYQTKVRNLASSKVTRSHGHA